MIKKIFIFVLIAVGVVLAQIQPTVITSPGAKGMLSNNDIQEMALENSYYARNVDVTTTLGAIRRRMGIVPVGTNTFKIYGAIGYYEPTKEYKTLLAYILHKKVSPQKDSLFLYKKGTLTVDSMHWTDTVRYALRGDTVIGECVMSACSSMVFTYNPDSTKPYTFGNWGSNTYRKRLTPVGHYNDFLVSNEIMITANDFALPSIFTPIGGLVAGTDTMADTVGYKPRFIPLGLPSPGQPQVIILNDTAAKLQEPLEYCYYYTNTDGTGPGMDTAGGDTSIHSIVVYPKGRRVMITGFSNRPFAETDTLTNGSYPPSRIFLFRRRAGLGEEYTVYKPGFKWPGLPLIQDDMSAKWTLVDRFFMDYRHSASIIDSGQSIDDGLYGCCSLSYSADIPAPGSINFWNKSGTIIDSAMHAGFRADRKIAYSWYDPILGIESPMGPSYTYKLVDTSAGDTILNAFSLGYLDEERNPTRWLRVYQTLTDSTDVWYGVLQIKVNINRVTGGQNIVYLGFLSEDSVATSSSYTEMGIDTLDMGGPAGGSYNNDNMVLDDDDGSIMSRPPYKDGLTIIFSDMEYANGRIWGVGDVLFPQRLYYSEYNYIDEWSALNYLSLSESDNDELVAIEAISSGEGDQLYAFKHNSVFVVTGYDIEYDLSFNKITSKCGVVDRRSIVKVDDEIYFLSPNMKIYKIDIGGLEEISQPVENYIDSFFVDYNTAYNNTYAFAMTNKVCWRKGVNILSYNIESRTWSTDNYSEYNYHMGTFEYDTLSRLKGFGENSYVYYQSYIAASLYKEGSYRYDSIYYNGAGLKGVFHLYYQTPFIGDGENWWKINSVKATMSGDSGTYIYFSVFNQANDSLCTDSIMINSRVDDDYTIGMPRHSGKYLSVRLIDKTATNNKGNFILRDIRLYAEPIGGRRIE